MYKCYYCGIKESPLQSIIEHCKLLHGEEILKYRQLVLDENHCVQTDPAKHVWTRAYLIPERNRTVRRQEEGKNSVY